MSTTYDYFFAFRNYDNKGDKSVWDPHVQRWLFDRGDLFLFRVMTNDSDNQLQNSDGILKLREADLAALRVQMRPDGWLLLVTGAVHTPPRLESWGDHHPMYPILAHYLDWMQYLEWRDN